MHFSFFPDTVEILKYIKHKLKFFKPENKKENKTVFPMLWGPNVPARIEIPLNFDLVGLHKPI